MSAFESIKKGLQQAIDHQRGGGRGVKVHQPRPVDVRAVRDQTGLTQEVFAATFAISPGTLRHWERGDRSPHGPALVLLNIIEREPGAVLRALHIRKPAKRKQKTATNRRAQAAARRTTREGHSCSA